VLWRVRKLFAPNSLTLGVTLLSAATIHVEIANRNARRTLRELFTMESIT
jgi:glutamate 5-kinase